MFLEHDVRVILLRGLIRNVGLAIYSVLQVCYADLCNVQRERERERSACCVASCGVVKVATAICIYVQCKLNTF